MKSIFLILILATSVFSAYVTNTPSGRFRDSLRVDSLRNSVGIGTDANGKFVKSDSTRACFIADSAKHVPIQDTVPYAENAGHADTADSSGVAGSANGFYHGIPKTYFLFSDSTGGGSVGYHYASQSYHGTLHWEGNTYGGNGPLLMFGSSGTYNTVNPIFQLFSNSTGANTYSRIILTNYQALNHYNAGWDGIESTKLTAGETVGGTRFSLITNVYNPYGRKKWHLSIYSVTGQLVLNDTVTVSDSLRPWLPVLIKHGGLKVSGKTILDTTPSASGLNIVLGKSSATGDTVVSISIDSLSSMVIPPHNVTPGQIPMSNGSTTFRNTGTTVDTVTGDMHLYGDLILGDTLYTGVTASIHGHGNASDVDKDSLVINVSSSSLGQSTRGAAIRLSGNESYLHGNAVLEAGDSGSVLTGGNTIQIHLDHPSDTGISGTPTFKTDLMIGRDSLDVTDTAQVAIYGGQRTANSAFKIYGGRGSSTTKSSIYLGNKISNRMDLSADTINLNGVTTANYIDATRIVADTIEASSISAPHGVTTGRHAVSAGASLWSSSNLRENAGGQLGIGLTPYANVQLTNYWTPTNTSDIILNYNYLRPTITVNGNYGGSVNMFQGYTNIRVGVSDAGNYSGIRGEMYHYSQGTAGNIYGAYIGYGSVGAQTGGGTLMAGLRIVPFAAGVGTWSAMYDILIDAPNATGATVTAPWCIYSLNPATSRLEGGLELDSKSARLSLGEAQQGFMYHDGIDFVFGNTAGNYWMTGTKLKIDSIPNDTTVDSVAVFKNGVMSFITVAQLDRIVNRKTGDTTFQVPCSLFDGTTFRTAVTATVTKKDSVFRLSSPYIIGTITASTFSWLKLPVGTLPTPIGQRLSVPILAHQTTSFSTAVLAINISSYGDNKMFLGSYENNTSGYLDAGQSGAAGFDISYRY
jgi:hypothetical protein